MKISKVEIKNFKRFHDLTINLGENPKKIVALIGQNGCGKSSVLDALISFSINSSYNGISKGYTPQYFFRGENQYPHNSIFLYDEEKIEIPRNRNLVCFRSPYRYNSNLNIQDIRAVNPISNNEDSLISSVHIDDRIEKNYRLLLAEYRDYMESNDVKPSEAKTHIIDRLNQSIKNCLDLEIDNLGNVEKGSGSIFFKKSDSDSIFGFNSLSSGEKEVVDLILDLYLRKEEYKGKIYVIDEPELHINTSIQRKLLLEINNLIDDDSQLWIATHSIGFIRALQNELNDASQIIEFKSDLKYASESITLSEMERTRSNWQNIFNTALDDLTGLIAPNRIIYCEGKDNPTSNGSEQGLDAKVYNNIFGKMYPDTVFVSSGGNTELDQRSRIALAIIGKVFSDIEIWVFKDRDIASGGDVSQDDREIYLENQTDEFRIMIRWEIENYLFDKEVLEKYCLNNGLNFDEEEYDKQITDIVNQDVKSLFNKIKKICGITTSINADKFKENLSKCITPDMKVYQELEECIFQRK